MDISNIYTLFESHPKISTDSRKIEKDSLFFALKGENFDGNVYAQEAIDKGAAYVIIDNPRFKKNDRTILVDDVLKTLQNLAKHHRMQLDIPIIGLTGSNGKTTSKELIHAVLSTTYNCLATEGNLNNHIGVPLTLLKINKEHQMAIIEMGANHVGEIAFLCNIAMPNYGLITNIGRAHIGEFGSVENIISTKTELYTSIQNNKGKLFVNGNDGLLMAKSAEIERTTYGSSSENYIQGSYLSLDPFVNVVFSDEKIEVNTQLVGKYNTDNILVAIAIGSYFKVPSDKIKNALEKYHPSNNRSQIQKTDRNTLIMDAYNANPSSVEVAIENLLAMDSQKKFFILGDMLELGDESVKEHQQIINLVKESGLNGVFVGPIFSSVFKNEIGIHSFSDTQTALTEIPKLNLSDNLILLKGSRGMKLETLCPVL